MRSFLVVAVLATSLCSCDQQSALMHKKSAKALPAPPQLPGQTETPPKPNDSSYAPVALTESFVDMRARLIAGKPLAEKLQSDLLNERYDMSQRAEAAVSMFHGKPVQTGVRVKLLKGMSWDRLAQMKPDEIRQKNAFPPGFMPLPHPRHDEGGQVLPQFHIDEIQSSEGRNLKRFDVELDIPDHFLPEFPAPIFLSSRPDLGDVSQGVLITIKNYFQIFDGILTPRQLDGLRLLLTPFAQQQFNLTSDRRTDAPELGISCLDCHANGHTNGATHLDPVTRPQEFRRRLDVPSLRGMNIQRLFGSQRAMKTVEDFTEFEQLGAYFDGDHVIAAKKGFNKLDRALQVAHMAEFQSLLDFPPAPKLDVNGKLIAELATPAELRGEQLFHHKAACASCHAAPYFTDNSMHDLKVERFFNVHKVNGRMMAATGPIKTFPLRGIRHSPPYLHDGRLLTLDDTVEFFNLVLQLRLTEAEKKDLLAFLYVL